MSADADGFRAGWQGNSVHHQSIVLTAGDDDEANIVVRDTRAAMTTPVLPVAGPVTVQWFDTKNNVCWGAAYTSSDVIENSATRFKARLGT